MTSADIENLKADIQKLRDDLGDMLGSIGSYQQGETGGYPGQVDGRRR